MKLILYQATIAITEIDFVPGPFRCQIELGHLDSAVDCPLGKNSVRLFFWAWYKLKLICVLYFQFVPSTEKVVSPKVFPRDKPSGIDNTCTFRCGKQYLVHPVLTEIPAGDPGVPLLHVLKKQWSKRGTRSEQKLKRGRRR